MSVGHAFQHVLEAGERLDVVEFGGGKKGSDYRPAGCPAIVAGEEVVLATERDGPNGAFDSVVIELDAAVIEEPAESLPADQRISDRIGQSPFWDPIELGLEPTLHGLNQRQRPDPSGRLSRRCGLTPDARLDRIEFGDTSERFGRNSRVYGVKFMNVQQLD